MLPPSPPSPPSGPPRGTNFSRRKLTQPRPPEPASTRTSASSMNFMFHASLERKGPAVRGLFTVRFVAALFGEHADHAAALRPLGGERYAPCGAGVQRVIVPHPHDRARVILRAALPDVDVPRPDLL